MNGSLELQSEPWGVEGSPISTISSPVPSIWVACAAILLGSAFVFGKVLISRPSKQSKHLPPLVRLDPHEQVFDPLRSYGTALEQNGSIIRVARQGREEYIFDPRIHAKEVMLDETRFSFLGGLSSTVFWFLDYLPGAQNFIIESNALVLNGVNGQLPQLVGRMAGVFERRLGKWKDTQVEVFPTLLSCFSEGMIVTIFGAEERIPSDREVADVSSLTVHLATLLGVFDNTALPRFSGIMQWAIRYFRLIKVGLYSIPILFGRTIGIRLWKLMTEEEQADEKAQEDWSRRAKGDGDEHLVIAVWLTRKVLKARRKSSKNPNAKLTLKDRLLVTFLCLALIFASAHQTAVVGTWTITKLAKHPEMAAQLWEEHLSQKNHVTTDENEDEKEETEHTVDSPLVQAALNTDENSPLLDSFMREVMRTKGDIFISVRRASQDTTLGGMFIPKDAVLIPYAHAVNYSPRGIGLEVNPEENGRVLEQEEEGRLKIDRWVGKNMSPSKASADYLAFGGGSRWTCPGRWLAVAELKLIVLILISRNSSLDIPKESMVIPDPLNSIAVAPSYKLNLTAR